MGISVEVHEHLAKNLSAAGLDLARMLSLLSDVAPDAVFLGRQILADLDKLGSRLDQVYHAEHGGAGPYAIAVLIGG
jgi:hypothetical protein